MTKSDQTMITTFDDLPDDLRREIMMKRAYRQSWDPYMSTPYAFACGEAKKRDLVEACRKSGLAVSGRKQDIGDCLGRHRLQRFLQRVYQCEQFWQTVRQ